MKRTLINEKWRFFKDVSTLDGIENGSYVQIDLPHTWNNLDGQDGGADYYRGTCFYTKELTVEKAEGKDYYLEFRGVNSICVVYVNGQEVVTHEGGFSTFRANVTDILKDGTNGLCVSVDNSANDRVYPQMADFTFFGGIYRDVYLLEVEQKRFDIDYYGGEGIMITPTVEGSVGKVNVKHFLTNGEGLKVAYRVLFDGKEIAKAEVDGSEECNLEVYNAVRWDSRENPALYTLEATLYDGEKIVDNRAIRFGFRTFSVDKDGFSLNGRRYPLHGVSRHQDRLDMGWAITKKEHKEDMDLIAELGANTIRLAHYQHDQYFYDLCDEVGMVVWAEIPYISAHLAHGDENAVSQMKELIVQNYNHPSIICWGLSNEITIAGETDELYALHHRLNDLCHEMDKTRYTTMANVTMLDTASDLLHLPDIMSYNHYFGWYVGDVEGNAEWLDSFRAEHPDLAIGISEYGCEAILTWHNSDPKQGDYSEEYQAYYHENLLRIFGERPYLWSTHVWNMFDFGVDGRDEGGVKGRNNKGLVTYDRKTKKDSYFIYKAYWTKEPFVHITSKRYQYRAEKVTKVKVYSNCDRVALYVNGKLLEEKQGKYIFTFDVKLPLIGKVKIEAVSGDKKDYAEIKRVSKPHEGYALPKKDTGVQNWFDKDGNKIEFNYPEGYFSIKDKLNAIMATEEGNALVHQMIDTMVSTMMSSGDGKPIKISEGMFKLVGGMTIERIAGMAGEKLTPDVLYAVNEQLNKIKKPTK